MSLHLSPTERMRQRRRWLVATGAALLAVGLVAGFYLGQRAAQAGMGIDPAEYREMQEQLPRVREQLAENEARLEMELTRHQVNRQALEMVRGEIAEQKERIADLEEELGFYRSVMAPGEINQGLSLRPIELVPRETPGRFAFRIVAQQQAEKHRLLKGSLSARVVGMLGEEQVSYPLATLSADLEGEAQSLRFRYFQAIEGEMILPEGFEPAGVSVEARVSSPRKIEVREEFPWLIKERFTHVGK